MYGQGKKGSELDGRSWVSLFSSMDPYFYRQDLSAKKRVLVRAAYVLLYAASMVLFAIPASRGLEANIDVWYVVAGEVCALFFAVWLLTALINYLLAGYIQSSADHNRSSFTLKRACIAGAASQVLTAAGTVGYLIHSESFTLKEGLWSGLYVLSAAMLMAVYVIERKIPYSQLSDPVEDDNSWHG
ncbi:MAG: hypothetical protein ACI3VB_02585 [Oscillospiraceae bacterium]